MASPTAGNDSDDDWDEFYDKFKGCRYKKGFNENKWEEEFDKIPMFMKKAPQEIDPQQHPELACLQAIIHDEDRPPEEQARSLKDEGNAFFKEKNYEKAILAYTGALKKKCGDRELDVVLLTNRAAAHFHLGNMRSALNDAVAAKKVKPDHLKALTRGAECCLALRHHTEALQWCDEGLRSHPSDKKLQDLRAAADKHKRSADRDTRKQKAREKKQHGQKEATLAAIKERGIKLSRSAEAPGSDGHEEDEGCSAAMAELSLGGLGAVGELDAQVFLDLQGSLHWPVIFLYPEHQLSDVVAAFWENNSFVELFWTMFGEQLPDWDVDRKYHPQDLELFFEDEQTETLHNVDPQTSLLEALQHKRFVVKSGTPTFLVVVKNSPFRKVFLTDKKIQWI